MSRLCNTCGLDFSEEHFYAGNKWKCKSCVKAYAKKRYQEKPELCKASTAAWVANNPERSRELKAAYRERNRETEAAYGKYRRYKFPEKVKQINGTYRKNHLEVYAAASAKRRASELSATPAWADLDATRAVYAEARRLTEETGIPHEVDHVVPLQGAYICGLHVVYNLRAIPRTVNRSKSNKELEHV